MEKQLSRQGNPPSFSYVHGLSLIFDGNNIVDFVTKKSIATQNVEQSQS